MKLIDYWIPTIKSLDEFKKISEVEQPEIDSIKAKISSFVNEVIVSEATADEGITRYERMLGLEKEESIELRRFNILSKLNNRIPYTLRWLKNKLDLVLGEDGYNLTLNNVNYWLTIGCPPEKQFALLSLTGDLRKQIPANIGLTIATTNVMEGRCFIANCINSYEKEVLNDNVIDVLPCDAFVSSVITSYKKEVL